MDRAQLADFLRKRRTALQPEDVGLPRGPRRRTTGLRREEVANLCGMSTDYYTRLEQQRGPQPSESMLAAMARGLRLSLDERDHLFRMAGHGTPSRGSAGDHVSPGLMRILDRLQDTPAQVMTGLGETLRQTPLAVALLGDETRFTGLARSATYRWFTDPAARRVYPPEDHELRGRMFTADLRAAYSRDPRAGVYVDALLRESPAFAALWREHEVGFPRDEVKRLVHPEVGELELHCQVLFDGDQSRMLLVFTATPGSESYEKLRLLAVIGSQELTAR
ncbi:MAG TPA: helix-turn-helix transcriptional regulator [Pseudonocardiaceae bacterium]|nr:helix-turn-helix transcriptional regulator [Pseudonocardiaceae bacterium]